MMMDSQKPKNKLERRQNNLYFKNSNSPYMYVITGLAGLRGVNKETYMKYAISNKTLFMNDIYLFLQYA